MVAYNDVDYFYVYNLQGDVVALIDANGTQVVEYGYDAWGYPISKTGTMAATLGTVNPFRYRGYVYDEETGLYFCGVGIIIRSGNGLLMQTSIFRKALFLLICLHIAKMLRLCLMIQMEN